MTFKNADGKPIVMGVVAAIQENRDYLSEVDGLIGDGDHGINMNKGFTMFKDKAGDEEMDLTTAMRTLGRTLLGDIGGSMGPLYGGFFQSMARASKGIEDIGADTFSKMLHGALDTIQSLGNAQPGDKTLIDCLVPATQAFDQAVEGGKDFFAALDDMTEAADKGRDSTKDMVAKLGRSARLGERSRGVLDAGATSCAIILNALAKGIKEVL